MLDGRDIGWEEEREEKQEEEGLDGMKGFDGIGVLGSVFLSEMGATGTGVDACSSKGSAELSELENKCKFLNLLANVLDRNL